MRWNHTYLPKFIYVAFIVTIDSLAAHGQAVVNIPPDSLPITVNSDTTINLWDGGAIPDDFSIGSADGSLSNIELNIMGGTVGRRLRIDDGATVNMSGGTAGPAMFADGGELNITGGNIQGRFDVGDGATVNLSGGKVTTTNFGGMRLLGGEVNFKGGEISGQLELNGAAGGVFNYKGGRIGQDMEVWGGNFNIFGGEFLLDGAPLEDFSDSLQLDIPAEATLSGTLPDGTTFAFNKSFTSHQDFIVDGTLTLYKSAIPTLGPLVIDVPSSPSPRGLRSGQILNLNLGGTIGDIFTANPGSTLNVNGGNVGVLLEAVNATINVSNGSVGTAFAAYSDSTVNVSGGVVSDLDIASGSVLSMSGGTILDRLEIANDSRAIITDGILQDVAIWGGTATILGGSLKRFVGVSSGGELNLAGGTFEHSVGVGDGSTINISGGWFGNTLTANAGSVVNIKGLAFLLDGVPISGLVPGVPLEITDTDATLSGTLSDGTPFEFDLGPNCPRCRRGINPGATLTVVQVPEPQSLYLALAILCLTIKRKSPITASVVCTDACSNDL